MNDMEVVIQCTFNYFFSEYALPAKVMQVTYPKLTIIDAAWTNPERNYGNIAVQLNMLLASTDPFAASWYAAKYMLTPVAYYPDKTNPDNIGGVVQRMLKQLDKLYARFRVCSN